MVYLKITYVYQRELFLCQPENKNKTNVVIIQGGVLYMIYIVQR